MNCRVLGTFVERRETPHYMTASRTCNRQLDDISQSDEAVTGLNWTGIAEVMTDHINFVNTVMCSLVPQEKRLSGRDIDEDPGLRI
jgi:hypothetical protein